MPVEGRRYAPYAAFAVAEFRLLLRRVLVQAVGRIGHNGVKAVVILCSNQSKQSA